MVLRCCSLAAWELVGTCMVVEEACMGRGQGCLELEVEVVGSLGVEVGSGSSVCCEAFSVVVFGSGGVVCGIGEGEEMGVGNLIALEGARF